MTEPTLSPGGYEIKAALDALHATQSSYETAVTEATDAQAKSAGDLLVTDALMRLNDEVDRLQARVDQIHRAGQRPMLGKSASHGASEHKAAFVERYLRKGQDNNLAGFEAKSLNITASAEGGYTVPPEIDRQIETKLRDVSPVRQIANVVQVGSALYKKLVATSGFASGWVSETAARPETTTPQFAEIAPPWGELYANPAITQAMLDDSVFDVEGWLATEIAGEFGKQEGAPSFRATAPTSPRAS